MGPTAESVNQGLREALRPFQADDRPMPTDPRIQRAIVRSSRALAAANEANESGKAAQAEKLYQAAQFWLDRYNKLTGEV